MGNQDEIQKKYLTICLWSVMIIHDSLLRPNPSIIDPDNIETESKNSISF